MCVCLCPEGPWQETEQRDALGATSVSRGEGGRKPCHGGGRKGKAEGRADRGHGPGHGPGDTTGLTPPHPTPGPSPPWTAGPAGRCANRHGAGPRTGHTQGAWPRGRGRGLLLVGGAPPSGLGTVPGWAWPYPWGGAKTVGHGSGLGGAVPGAGLAGQAAPGRAGLFFPLGAWLGPWGGASPWGRGCDLWRREVTPLEAGLGPAGLGAWLTQRGVAFALRGRGQPSVGGLCVGDIPGGAWLNSVGGAPLSRG